MTTSGRVHPTAKKVHHFTLRHFNKLLAMFIVNVVLAFIWGPTFITLTLLGPTRSLSSTVVWVAIISYYANMMGNIATAAGLFSAMTAHAAKAATAADHRQLESDIASLAELHPGEDAKQLADDICHRI